MKKRILFTGGTGFFGKTLLEWLAGNEECRGDAHVTLLSREPQRFLAENPTLAQLSWLDFVAGDIRSFTLPQGVHFDYVIHGATAASARLEREQPDEMYSVIVDGTKHLLKAVEEVGVKRLLFISSGAVYGRQPPTVTHLSEDYCGEPITAYGRGKKVGEMECLAAAERQGFACVIARPFAFVGSHLPRDSHFAIGNFMRDCLLNQTITIKGDGTPLRSYLYAADLAEWLWVMLHKGDSGGVYNVGSDEAISIKELAYKVRACVGTTNAVEILGKPDPTRAIEQYVPCIKRAQNELGLVVRYSLDEAIRASLVGG